MAKWGIQEKHFQRAPKFSNISVCRLGRLSRFRVDFGGKVGLFNVLYNFGVGVRDAPFWKCVVSIWALPKSFRSPPLCQTGKRGKLSGQC